MEQPGQGVIHMSPYGGSDYITSSDNLLLEGFEIIREEIDVALHWLRGSVYGMTMKCHRLYNKPVFTLPPTSCTASASSDSSSNKYKAL